MNTQLLHPVMYLIVSDQARPWGAPQSPELWGSSRDGQLQAVKAISSARKARPPCSGQLPSQGLSRKGNKTNKLKQNKCDHLKILSSAYLVRYLT